MLGIVALLKVMETNRDCLRICILLLYFSFAAISFTTHCDASRSMQLLKGPTHPRSSIIKHVKKLKVFKHFDLNSPLDSLNTQPYGANSPFSLPPFDSLAPIPLPENTPPFCIYPPFTPQPPSTTTPTPIGFTPSPPFYFPPLLPIPSPPPSPIGAVPSPPENTPPFCIYPPFTPQPPSTTIPTPIGFTPSPPFCFPPLLPIPSPPPSPTGTVPSPPESSPTPNPPETFPSPNPPETVRSPPSNIPGPPESVPSPPIYVPGPPGSMLSPPYYEPSPPSYEPSPPSYVPTPGGGFTPSPPVFQPPVVYPPPTGLPPPHTSPSLTLWCVAKPSVPDPIIEEAMNYACGSGADCASIQPDGSCYQPNTLLAHASYAFNSYWQSTKVAGGTCEFGGTAILVAIDPSYDGCHFIYY